MSLRDYDRKRRFDKTPEPDGRSAAQPTPRPIFVVQLHHASSRHYDFRLEIDGVLKSWAVPKGPSLRAGEKRLAVEVEDHPLSYAGFKGDIPKGNYGAGHVEVFDHGHWASDGDPLKALAAGKLDFTLTGGRLVGGWKLVRTRLKGKQPQWLLIKRSDAHAADTDADVLVAAVADKPDQAIARPRTTPAGSSKKKVQKTAHATARLARSWRERALALPGARDTGLPCGFAPALATLRPSPPAGDDWLHELKWDGYRLLVDLERGAARLRSRGGLDWNETFPEVVRAVQALPVADACLDGELLVLNEHGGSDFAELQRVIDGTSQAQLRYLIFDLVGLCGVDLRQVPLVERKAALKSLLGSKVGLLASSDHVVGHGPEVFRQTGANGIEGIVSKRLRSTYHAGRGGDWIKCKHVLSDEFIVIGYTQPKGARHAFGALLMAARDGDALRYVGRVGSGFDSLALTQIHAQLRDIERDAAVLELPSHIPFAPGSVQWVKPSLVVEVAYRGWAKEGLLRQSSFLRLRPDKSVNDVGASTPDTALRAKPRTQVLDRRAATKAAKVKRATSGDTHSSPATARTSSAKRVSATIQAIRITHADRVVFSDSSYTKQQVADYYASVARWLLPELIDRPMSVVRCPDGSQHDCFFQKHHAGSLGRAVRSVTLKLTGGNAHYLYVDSIDGVLDLVQMGTVELHPWGSTVQAPERPDRLVFDLDPGDGVTWPATVAAARDIRAKLKQAGLQSFVRLSGGKGLHVVVPMDPGPSWDDVRTFCEAFAHALAAHAPDRYVATMAKVKRPGKIFVDWLRNARGSTSVASWSLRARPGAPVAVPLRWPELGRITRPGQFDLEAARLRASTLRKDPWHGIATLQQQLPDFT